MAQKNIVILGSTGSIGVNTLKVCGRYPDRFRVVGLSCYSNFELFEKQVRQFEPRFIALTEQGIARFKKLLTGKRVRIFRVEESLAEMVSAREADVVVIGMRGSAALEPFLAAVRCGKTVAPANKEALVIAGDHLMKEARKNGARIIPIDSEQSAIFQCLEGRRSQPIRRILLTASGGALRKLPKSRFDSLTVKQILSHPRWKMGEKITVDSATLLNKGFEVIEAMRLFDQPVDKIEVVIHPQAIIHSMVEFDDGSVIAQMGVTDMKLPIQYALTYPQRLPTGLKPLDFAELKKLTFERPDFKKFPLLELAFHVARKGGTLPSVLNAADEMAVEAFLNKKIRFTHISRIVEKVVMKHKINRKPDLEDILAADRWAREEAGQLLRK